MHDLNGKNFELETVSRGEGKLRLVPREICSCTDCISFGAFYFRYWRVYYIVEFDGWVFVLHNLHAAYFLLRKCGRCCLVDEKASVQYGQLWRWYNSAAAFRKACLWTKRFKGSKEAKKKKVRIKTTGNWYPPDEYICIRISSAKIMLKCSINNKAKTVF